MLKGDWIGEFRFLRCLFAGAVLDEIGMTKPCIGSFGIKPFFLSETIVSLREFYSYILG